jgi:hypothetical protein
MLAILASIWLLAVVISRVSQTETNPAALREASSAVAIDSSLQALEKIDSVLEEVLVKARGISERVKR